ALLAERHQIAQPAEAVQLDGEPAAGAWPVPRIAARADLQRGTGECKLAGQDAAAVLWPRRAQVPGPGRETFGLRLADPPLVQRRARPLALGLGADQPADR